MAKCQRCGEDNPSRAKFCLNAFEPLPRAAKRELADEAGRLAAFMS